MANEPTIPLVGNLTADPELRYTQSGTAVCNFTVAQTPRQYDKNSNQYVDGNPLFMSCHVWKKAAENASQSLAKGMRVIVVGRLRQRSWEDKEGNKRTTYEVEVDSVGPDLTWATATVTRNPSNNSYGGQPQAGSGWNNQPTQQSAGGGWNNQPQQQGGQQPQTNYNTGQPQQQPQQQTIPQGDPDPWNSAPQGQQGTDQEPPF